MFLCKAENGKRIVTVLSAPFGGPYNGRDGHNQRFSPRTNFHLDKFGLPPLVYYHGWKPDGEPAKSPVYIGKTTRVWADERGVWHEGELFDGVAEADLIWEEGQKDKVRASTGTSPLARARPDGEITEWPIVELTLVDVDYRRKVINPYAVTYMGDKLPPHLVKARQADEELATAEEMDEQTPTEETMFIFKSLMSPDPAAASGGVAQDAPQNSGASGTAETAAVTIDYEKLAKAIVAVMPQAPAPATPQSATATNDPQAAVIDNLVKAAVDARLANYVGNNGGLQKAGAQAPAAPITEDKQLKALAQQYEIAFNAYMRGETPFELRKAMAEARSSEVYAKAVKAKNPLVKAISVTVDADGAFWVPQTWANQVFAFEKERNIFRQMAEAGQLMWEGIGKTKTHNKPSWDGDDGPTAVRVPGAAYTVVNPSAGNFTWVPYENGFDVQAQDEALQDIDYDVWGDVVVPFASRAFTKWENYNFTLGTGTAMPEGVTVNTTLGETAASATAITGQEILNLLHSVPEYLRSGPGFAFMMNDATVGLMEGLVYPNTEKPLLVTHSPNTYSLAGAPVIINSRIPDPATTTKPIILGNFRYMQIYTFDSGNFSMRRLNELYAGTGHVGFRFMARHDSEFLDTAAFKHLLMA
ncbi:MAG: phage major capsid protein [Chloroflexi bacterium]|nr:phage major capsid protein [Chloroflexota bacterium]